VFQFVGGDASLSSLVSPLETVPLRERDSTSHLGKLFDSMVKFYNIIILCENYKMAKA